MTDERFQVVMRSTNCWLLSTVVVVAMVAAACSSTSSTSTSQEALGGSASSPATSSEAGCSPVVEEWVKQLDMPSGSYVFVEVGTASNGHPAWIVLKEDGAAWATDVDPSTKPSSGGLIVPINDKARSESNIGAGLSQDQITNLFPVTTGAIPTNCS
jgi:hypothetical protein